MSGIRGDGGQSVGNSVANAPEAGDRERRIRRRRERGDDRCGHLVPRPSLGLDEAEAPAANPPHSVTPSGRT